MKVGDSTRIPATAAQAGMWFAQRMVPGSSAFVIAHAWDVRGHVDLTVLRQALTGAIRDADGLGTRFAPDDEDGVTAEPAAWDVADVRVVDLSHEADPEAAADSRIRGHARTPIDPASEPCFGAEILVLGPDRTSIALWAHHIVLDVFGFGLLARRVAALYRAGGTDQSSRRPVSAAALVDEEAAYRASDARSEDFDFWADELRGVAAPEWPTVPEGHHVAREVRTTVVRLDRATTTALHDFAAADGRSWGEAFTALLGTFVSSRTAENEVVLGFPMMNRLGSVAATVPAMAVNVAPLRLRVGPHATARTALAETSAAVSRIRSHTRMRGEELSRGTGGVRPRVWANIKPFSDTLRLGDASATIRSISRGPVPGLSVTAQIVGSDDGVHGELELCVDGDAASFDDSALEQCAADLCAHVSASLAHPDTGVAHLPAPTPAEGSVRHGAPATQWETVSDMFFDVVARRGTDVAVTSGPEQLTYTELGARVARVARWLAGRGVGTEDRVAVSMPRGVDAVVSLLGVLASGAGVVPMDPSHPRERRERMLADSAPALVLTTESIDDAAPELARLPHGPVTDSDRVRGVWGGSVGCVLFTSGSTGVPKGVVGSQAGLANRVSWAVDRWSVPAGVPDVRVSKSAVTFVDGVTELLAGLCSGARVVLASDEVAVDPVALRGLMVRESVTQVTGVPSLLSAVFDGDAGELGALRLFRVVSSGERLDPAVAEVIRAAVPGVELVDSYGSSEIAGDVLGADGAALTTGMTYVVPGTRVHVLDAWLRPVVPGVVGELYVSGVQVARGYSLPGLSAERFVASPFGVGERLFRTGDLACVDGDRVVLRGRRDDQVKIRGVRVELGEIESVLARCVGVESAVARVRRSAEGSVDVVGYVTPASVDVVGVRREAAGWLPSAVVPAVVVPVDGFARTSSGKVDRAALPDPVVSGSSRLPESVAECRVAALFAEVLGVGGVESLGVESDFFALGGHSIVATRLVARLPGVSVRDVFDHPTIGELAALVDSRAGDTPPTRTGPELRRRGSVDTPLSNAQRGLWFRRQLEPENPMYNIPFAIRVPGALDAEALARAARTVVARNSVLRSVFPEGDEGRGIQRRLDDFAVPFEVVTLPDSAHTDEQARTALFAEHVAERVRRPFDLGTEIPIRVSVVAANPSDPRSPEGESLVLVLVHHIAADEWSAPIVVRELSTAYAAALGEGTVLPEPALEYGDYALWEAEVAAAHTAAHERDHRYWRDRLAGAPEQLPLPYDAAALERGAPTGDTVFHSIDVARARRLAAVAQEHRATMFVLVHAAAALTLGALADSADVVVGTPVTSRADERLHELIGCFVDTVALRTDLSTNPTLGALLETTRHDDLDAFDHRVLPFDRVVDVVGAQRTLASHPIFQTMVQFRAHRDALRFGGRSAEFFHTPVPAAKFDLTFDVEDTGDGLAVRLEYATSLFTRATADAIATRFVAMLDAFEDTTRRVSELDVLLPGEPRSLPGDSVDGETTVADLFARAVSAYPERTAVTAETTSGRVELSYREIGGRVARLARFLSGCGVGAEDRVAVAMPRGVDSVVSLLGVLASGAGIVPIDPSHPRERVVRMLADAAPALVLTVTSAGSPTPQGDTEFAGVLATCGAPVVYVDDDTVVSAVERGSDAPLSDADRVRGVWGGSVGCVLFTSGSTGVPKGVVGSQAGLANRVSWAVDRWSVPAGVPDVRVSKSAVTFVDGVTELLAGLCSGARVVLASDGVAVDPVALRGLMVRESVTQVTAVPTMLGALFDGDGGAGTGAQDVPPLHRVVSSGERLDPRVAATVQRAMPGVELVDSYGSSEIAGDVSFGIVGSDVDPGGGRPVPGAVLHVLDRWLRPVVPGVVGELYVSGVQVARGYSLPGLSAERFVASPFGVGERLFRTGDLACVDGDRVVLRGRRDDQVKIRGVRVELGEIESVLARCVGVESAVARVRRSAEGSVDVVGYVTPASVDVVGVRREAAGWLPSAVVPAVVVPVDGFARTSSGKVDRAALPDPVVSVSSRLPESVAECRVAALFAEVLGVGGVESLGVESDFFALGGDSIVSMTLVRRAAKRGITFTARDVFEHRTIGALAAHAVVDTDAAEPDSAQADAARTEADQDPVDVAPWPLVHRARRSGVDPSSLVLTESVPAPDGLDPDTVAQRLAAVVDATPALRVRVTPKSRLRWKVEVCPPGAAPAPGRLDSVSVADALDVTEARTVAFALRDGELILAAHGLCLDRWSLHELAVAVAAGTEPFASSAGVVEVGARLDESARSEDADTRAREYADTVTQFPSRDDGSAAVPERTQHWERTLTDVPVEPGAVRDVVVHALSEAVHPGAIDVEVDLRPLAAGDGAAGAWTASAPVPVAGDAWFPLVRFGNSTGRKLLGKMPSASAFVTRAYGEQVDATRREGVESLYPVVVRYTVPGGESVGRGSVRFDVFGPATLDGDALLDRVAGELGAPVAVR